jgi:hypothetical protein
MIHMIYVLMIHIVMDIFDIMIYMINHLLYIITVMLIYEIKMICVEHQNEPADCPALRSDGPRSGRSAPVGRTVRACAEQIRVPSFVLRLLAKIAG